MTSTSSTHFTDTFRKASKFLAWGTVIISLLIFLEWLFVRIHDYRLMSPISSLLFFLSSYAFVLKFNDKHNSTKNITRSNWICYFIFLICLSKIVLIYTGIDSRLSLFWISHFNIPLTRQPTLMAANTIITFILIALSILLLDDNSGRKTFIAQFICVIVFFLSLFAAYGYVLKVRYLYTLFLDVAISHSTILCFFILSLSILLSRPQTGFMRILVGEHLKENFWLRLLATLTPLILGFIKFKAEDLELVSKTITVAIFTLINYSISWTIIAFNIKYQKKIRRINQKTFDHLKWNELRLSTIAENISEGVIIVKKSHEATYINSIAKNLITNFKKDLPLKKWPETYGFYKTADNNLIDYSDMTINKALKGINVDNKEIKLINNGSEPSSILMTGRPVLNKEGKVIEGILIMRDITARRKIEKEYYKTSIKLRTILAELDEALIIIDEEGNHIYSTPEAEKIIGKFPSATININNWTNYFGLYYTDKFTFFPVDELPIKKALKGEKCEPVKLYVNNKHLENGHYIRLSCTPVIDDKKSVYGVLISLEKA